jgi:hypothetical protein
MFRDATYNDVAAILHEAVTLQELQLARHYWGLAGWSFLATAPLAAALPGNVTAILCNGPVSIHGR